MRANGYGQYTQVAESSDGLHFTPLSGIVARDSYLRVFEHNGEFYGFVRLGRLLRAKDVRGAFELGPSPFRDGPYAGRVRHLAVLAHPDKLDVFLSAIGDAPERILHTTIPLTGDWTGWKATEYEGVLGPEAS